MRQIWESSSGTFFKGLVLWHVGVLAWEEGGSSLKSDTGRSDTKISQVTFVPNFLPILGDVLFSFLLSRMALPKETLEVYDAVVDQTISAAVQIVTCSVSYVSKALRALEVDCWRYDSDSCHKGRSVVVTASFDSDHAIRRRVMQERLETFR